MRQLVPRYLPSRSALNIGATAPWLSAVVGALVALLAGCDSNDSSEPVYDDLRVYSDPYSEVDWINDVRLKSQHHDHVGISEPQIRAYDSAGYAALSLLDYSGNPELSYAWGQRLWPPEAWLSPALLSGLSNIQIFIPNAEEVGDHAHHVTSPFLTTYIERWPSNSAAPKQPWQYSTLAEMVGLIRGNGGLPCLAHPWEPNPPGSDFVGMGCVEIYTAFAEASRFKGERDFVTIDRNQVLLRNWDRVLSLNQEVWGIAVNDHFGASASVEIPESIRDSGKTLVIAKAPTLEAYETAFRHGAFFAIRDMGVPKDQYPVVHSIVIDAETIRIETSGDVTWISGRWSSDADLLDVKTLPANARYVRAEILNASGSVIYTQAFKLRPIGDIDGDYDVDDVDSRICVDLPSATAPDPLRVAACEAVVP